MCKPDSEHLTVTLLGPYVEHLDLTESTQPDTQGLDHTTAFEPDSVFEPYSKFLDLTFKYESKTLLINLTQCLNLTIKPGSERLDLTQSI